MHRSMGTKEYSVHVCRVRNMQKNDVKSVFVSSVENLDVGNRLKRFLAKFCEDLALFKGQTVVQRFEQIFRIIATSF